MKPKSAVVRQVLLGAPAAGRSKILFDRPDGDLAVCGNPPAGVGRHLPAETRGVGEVTVEATEFGVLRLFQDGSAKSSGSLANCPDLILGFYDLRQAHRRRARSRRCLRPAADVALERIGAKEG